MDSVVILNVTLEVHYMNREISSYHQVSQFSVAHDNSLLSLSRSACKAPVKSSTPTNNNTQLFTDWMPFLLPNQKCRSTEGKLQYDNWPQKMDREREEQIVLKNSCSITWRIAKHILSTHGKWLYCCIGTSGLNQKNKNQLQPKITQHSTLTVHCGLNQHILDYREIFHEFSTANNNNQMLLWQQAFAFSECLATWWPCG